MRGASVTVGAVGAVGGVVVGVGAQAMDGPRGDGGWSDDAVRALGDRCRALCRSLRKARRVKRGVIAAAMGVSVNAVSYNEYGEGRTRPRKHPGLMYHWVLQRYVSAARQVRELSAEEAAEYAELLALLDRARVERSGCGQVRAATAVGMTLRSARSRMAMSAKHLSEESGIPEPHLAVNELHTERMTTARMRDHVLALRALGWEPSPDEIGTITAALGLTGDLYVRPQRPQHAPREGGVS